MSIKILMKPADLDLHCFCLFVLILYVPFNIFSDVSQQVFLGSTSDYSFICVFTLWSPAGKGLTSLLSFVMSNCEVVTFPLVSWVRCDA